MYIVMLTSLYTSNDLRSISYRAVMLFEDLETTVLLNVFAIPRVIRVKIIDYKLIKKPNI